MSSNPSTENTKTRLPKTQKPVYQKHKNPPGSGQGRRPRPADEAGRRHWGRGLLFSSATLGAQKMQGTATRLPKTQKPAWQRVFVYRGVGKYIQQ